MNSAEMQALAREDDSQCYFADCSADLVKASYPHHFSLLL